MKSLIIAALVLLVPAAVLAQPTMGIYYTFEPFVAQYSPGAGESFNGYVYVHNTDCYLTAVEFMVAIGFQDPMCIIWNGWEALPGWINLGDPLNGISLTGWPPLDGWNPGYNLIMVMHFVSVCDCVEFGGILVNLPISIVPHPDTGGVRGTCWPDNILFDYIGMSSTICPFPIGTEDKSWGAIKSMMD